MGKRKYGVFGPFEVPRRYSGRVATPRKPRGFWEEVGENDPGLPDASGCYIVGIRAGKGATPWYVGQAKKAFREECFTSHKRLHYNEVLADLKRGKPILLLLARQTPKGKFVKKLSKPEADILENLLIYKCLHTNRELLNIGGTSFFKEAEIPGLLNSPRGPRWHGVSKTFTQSRIAAARPKIAHDVGPPESRAERRTVEHRLCGR